MRSRILALSSVLVVAAACSGGSHPTSAATTVPPPPTTAALNPDVIPPVITASYVDAVFRVLNHIDGDVSRSLIADRRLSPESVVELRSIYNDPLYAQEVHIAQQTVQGSLTDVRHPLGDIVTTVHRLIAASATCVFVSTQSNYSEVLVKPGPPAASEYWRLSPKQPGDDPRHLNPTAWALSFNADYLAPTTIPNQCAAS